MLGLNTEHTDEEYQAFCDRMAAKAEAEAERVEETIPSIGDGLPPDCPIIPSPAPATEPATWGRRTYTVEEMNRATLEHRNREQARFADIFRLRHARELLAAKEAKPEPDTMQERIIKALTGADPLATAAVRRVVGGRKDTVSKALSELRVDGRIEVTKVNPKMYLWSLPASGSQEGGTAVGGTPPPTGVGGPIPYGDSPTFQVPHAEPEHMKAETTIQGTNTREKAASILKLMEAGEIEPEDFAILMKKGVPEFVEAYRVAIEASA